VRAVVLLTAVAASLALAAPAQAVPQWLAPVDVDIGRETAVFGDLAVAPDGTTMSAWVAKVGDRFIARARVRHPGQGFGPTLDLTPASGFDAGRTRVGVDQQGNFTVTWDEDTVPATTTVVKAARLAAGADAFEPKETVSTGPGSAFSPEIAVGGNGTAVIAYHQGGNLLAAIRLGAGGQFENGTPLTPLGSFTDPELGVDDAGRAIAVWSRDPVGDGREVVQASERPAGLGFGPPIDLSSNVATDKNNQPALAMPPDGRPLVLWTHEQGGTRIIQALERMASGTWPAVPETASKPGNNSSFAPTVAISVDGTAVGAWLADVGTTVVQAGVRRRDEVFGQFVNITSTAAFDVTVVGNRAGDAMLAFTGPMSGGIFAARRPAGGTFGSVDTVALGTQGSAMPSIALNLQAVGIDDQSNATALWQQETNPGGNFVYSLHAASFDAAPPRLDAVSVPGAGNPGAAIGMAATASDRLSSPAITWSFGDGASASGPAVSHAYGAPGAYTVTVTATDAAGNAASESHAVLISAPVIEPPPETPRIDSPVLVTWGVQKKRIFLLRLKVTKVPKGAKAQLRCKGTKCPFKRMSSSKRRKGAITLYKEIKARKVVGKRKRSFRAGQRLQLRVTAPGFIGKVVKYRLKKGKIPSGRQLCLPLGATKPQRSC
jgi:hypothetical protein